MPDPRPLVLASGSSARRLMLKAAGLEFEIVSPRLDEAEIRRRLLEADASAPPELIAEGLARAKAEAASAGCPHALVIGADQILAWDGKSYSKATDRQAARETLLQLRGYTHRLISAVALVEPGQVTWTAVDSAELTMRAFSERFLDEYLARAGDALLTSVGAYEVEGLGIQLFERVTGDWFTIMGMPLLPLLSELRRRGVLMF
jgi:septum formation protein